MFVLRNEKKMLQNVMQLIFSSDTIITNEKVLQVFLDNQFLRMIHTVEILQVLIFVKSAKFRKFRKN